MTDKYTITLSVGASKELDYLAENLDITKESVLANSLKFMRLYVDTKGDKNKNLIFEYDGKQKIIVLE
jgi:hypothetical protein